MLKELAFKHHRVYTLLLKESKQKTGQVKKDLPLLLDELHDLHKKNLFEGNEMFRGTILVSHNLDFDRKWEEMPMMSGTFGHPISSIPYPMEETIDYNYDNRDHITKISSQGNTSCFSYDASGNPISHTDSSYRKTRYSYDSFSRLVQTVDPMQEIATYEYGPSGLSRMNLPNGSTREIFYDEYHRPIGVR